MITISSNAGEVFANIQTRLSNIDSKQICMKIAVNVAGEMKQRIHKEGKAADGSQIGTYSDGYMKVRTDNFKSKKIVRGAKKGQPRPKYNRTGDTKVIASLTRQMEDSFKVFPTEKGAAIGWEDDFNFNKSHYVEGTYGKPVWKLAEREREIANLTANEEINKVFA